MFTYLTLNLLSTARRALGRGRGEHGQDLIEYSLLGGGIAATLLLAGFLLNDAITAMMTGVGECIDFDNGTDCM